MRLVEGKTGDFSETTVHCACEVSRGLAEALMWETNPPCKGFRPWLGPEAQESCEEGRPRLVMRGASNTYFPLAMSALTIPESESEVVELVRGLMDVLANATKDNITVLRAAIAKLNVLTGLSDADVLAAIERVKNPPGGERPPAHRRVPAIHQPASVQDRRAAKPGDIFFARRYAREGLPTGIRQLVLTPRLRRSGLQLGFTRLESPTANLARRVRPWRRNVPARVNTNWLPARRRGRGRVRAAGREARPLVGRPPRGPRARSGARRGVREVGRVRESTPPFPGARFYLLHSLSHLRSMRSPSSVATAQPR